MVDIRLTNAAIMVEYQDTVISQRLTNAAIMVEYKDTIIYERLTNAAIMVEYRTGYVHTHAVAMPDYYGLYRGIIIPGDRTRVFVDAEPPEPYPGIIWVEE